MPGDGPHPAQPSLPMIAGRVGTMTHDYKRHDTTDLVAAMNVATGDVLTTVTRATPRRGRAALTHQTKTKTNH